MSEEQKNNSTEEIKEQEENIETNENQEEASSSEENEQQQTEDTPEEIIKKLNDEIDSLKDQRLRAVAELENFRRRAEKDQSDALKYGMANFAKEIINIKDNK